MSKKYKLLQRYPGLHESFKVGDIVVEDKKASFYYREEEPKTGIVSFHVINNPEFWEEIKEQQLLFTTEDGVDIYDKEQVLYLVNEKSLVGIYIKARYWDKTRLVFADAAKALKYIEDNKPKYSKKDMIAFGYEANADIRFDMELILEEWEANK